MGVKAKALGGLWMAPLLSVAGLAFPSNDLRLVDAAQKGAQQVVRSLLEQNADVNAPQADGATALMWAAFRDDLETAELLIGAGANVNAANDYGATALWLACTNGNGALVEKLLQAGADPNAALLAGETALMAAAATSVDAVKALLAHGADVNAKEPRREQTALMGAVAKNRPDVARVLIEHGADVHARSKDGFTPLMFAAEQGDLASSEVLLAAGVNVNDAAPDGTRSLLLASASGQEQLVVFLLEQGADPNAADRDGYTALHHAAPRRNMLGAVRALLAHGANPNAPLVKDPARGDSHRIHVGATPFFLAAGARNIDGMRSLAAGGADPLLATTETVFMNAPNGRRLQMVGNTTPLMMAAGGGRYRGNYPQFTETEERTALEAVKLALELGSDIHAANEYGQTALHAATYLGADTIIRFLLEKGANINGMDEFEQTPLSIAQRVHTVRLGSNFDMQPRRAYNSTANLLLGLGATPLADLGVQVLEEIR